MNRAAATLVGVGAMAGTAVRWGVTELDGDASWPWGLLAVNVAGSLVLGWLLAERWADDDTERALRLALGVGFCGSLTTMSAFGVAVAELGRDERWAPAVGYTAASLLAASAAVVVGATVRRRWTVR